MLRVFLIFLKFYLKLWMKKNEEKMNRNSLLKENCVSRRRVILSVIEHDACENARANCALSHR